MVTIDTCKIPEEAWVWVHQLLGDILRPVRSAVKNRPNDLLYVVEKARGELIDGLGEIAERMENNGHTDDAKKIMEIWHLVIQSDLTKPEAVEAIHEKSNDLSEQARALRRVK